MSMMKITEERRLLSVKVFAEKRNSSHIHSVHFTQQIKQEQKQTHYLQKLVGKELVSIGSTEQTKTNRSTSTPVHRSTTTTIHQSTSATSHWSSFHQPSTSELSEQHKLDYGYLTPNEFDIFRDTEGQERAMDGRTPRVQRRNCKHSCNGQCTS